MAAFWLRALGALVWGWTLTGVQALLPKGRLMKSVGSLQKCTGSTSRLTGAAGADSPSISSEGKLTTGLLLDECSGMGNASGGMVKTMRWNEQTGGFDLMYQSKSDAKRIKKRTIVSQLLWEMFMPTGELTPDYYAYTLWRLAQRFVGASSSVFGTQALVLALGFKSSSIGIAAATRWVLKDALGKFSRIFWASKHGRKFDFNAKKWRFRSAILFAMGNGFEILTYIFPSFFLLLAAVANASKQMAMLTSSATRNAIYKSFSRKSDNIGDITAKGEAQIAVVDLLGMMVGIFVARLVSGDQKRMVAAFCIMSVLDIFCIHKEIRSVIFNTLNFERTGLVLRSLFLAGPAPTADNVLTPFKVAQKEELLMPYSVSETIFTTWSGLSNRVSPEHLKASYQLFFPNQRFCIVMHRGPGGGLVPQVLLRKEALPVDIFRALVVVHKALHEAHCGSSSSSSSKGNVVVDGVGCSEEHVDQILRDAAAFERDNLPRLMQDMRSAGWDIGNFQYGSVSNRVLW